MHELSLCQSIFDVVDRARRGRRVAVIHLDIGRLRQVVPETLVYNWELVSEAGPLEGSELDINSIPLRLRCRDCGDTSEVGRALAFVCPACGSVRVAPVSGEEFAVTSIDVLTEGTPA